MVSQVLNEKKVLELSRNPFVVKLHYAFHSKEYLYLVRKINKLLIIKLNQYDNKDNSILI